MTCCHYISSEIQILAMAVAMGKSPFKRFFTSSRVGTAFIVLGFSSIAVAILVSEFVFRHRAQIVERVEIPPASEADLRDPVLIARAVDSPDPKLVSWLERWKSDRSMGRSVSVQEQGDLSEILSNSGLSSLSLIKIAPAFHSVSQDDVTSLLFYDAIASRVDKELNSANATPASRSLVLLAIAHDKQDLKDVVWDCIQQHGGTPYAVSLCSIYTNLIRWASPDDPDVVKAARDCKPGLGELLYIMGRTDDSHALLESLRSSQMQRTGEKPKVWALIYAMELSQEARYTEAIPLLMTCVGDDNFMYEGGVWGFLIDDLCCLGRGSEANKFFKEYIRHVHPSFEASIRTAFRVQRALAN